ncbi:MAG: hypothetical protein GYA55_09460, partial [SAR324 cluster bacterium]|nr:hypothetical protein [SAR324 cluster bacterium]
MKKIIPIFLLILFYVSPAFSLDLAAYASYWDAKDSKGAWGTGAKLGIPLFTDHLQIDARAYWYPETSDDTVGNIEFL